MKHIPHPDLRWMAFGMTLLLASGCTLKASTESLTDTTTNFLSSTTPGAWFTEDGLINPDQRLNLFLATNYEALQQDMAKGEGEYLTSLGTLLEIPEEEMPRFKTGLQEQLRFTQYTNEGNPQKFLTLLKGNHARESAY